MELVRTLYDEKYMDHRYLAKAGVSNQIKLNLFKILFTIMIIAILLVMEAPLYADDYLPNKKITGEIENQIDGKILDEKDGAGLYGQLKPIFYKLVNAQKKLNSSDRLMLNYFLIVNSPNSTAFVLPVQNGQSLENYVVITTGILNRMSRLGDKWEIEKGLNRIIGVLSHELAHPLDIVDVRSLDSKSIKILAHGTADKAIEVRADIDGSMIAIEAGFDRESVLESLKHSKNTESDILKRVKDWLAAGLASHPTWDLRILLLESRLAELFFGEGTTKPDELKIQTTYLSHLKRKTKWDEPKNPFIFKRPTNFTETAKRIQDFKLVSSVSATNGVSETFNTLEYNRLVVTAFKDIIKTTANKSPSQVFTENPEILTFFENQFIKRVYQNQIHPLDSVDLERIVPPEYKDQLIVEDHVYVPELVRKSEFLSSPEFQEWMLNKFEAALDEVITHDKGNIRTSGTYLAAIFAGVEGLVLPEMFYERLGEKIVPLLLKRMRFVDSQLIVDLRGNYDIIYGTTNDEHRLIAANFFRKRIMPELTSSEQGKFYLSKNYLSQHFYSFVFPRYDIDQFDRSDRVKKFIQGRSRHKNPSTAVQSLNAEVEIYKNDTRKIWENRGYYATLDFLMPRQQRTDWELIMSLNNIDPQVGYSQLRSAIKAFTSSEDYKTLLKSIETNELHATGNAINMFEDARLSLIEAKPWLDNTLGPYLRGDYFFENNKDYKPESKPTNSTAYNYYVAIPEAYKKTYEIELKKFIAGKVLGIKSHTSISMDDLVGFHNKVSLRYLGNSAYLAPFYADSFAKIIFNTNELSLAAKRSILRSVFLEPNRSPQSRISNNGFIKNKNQFWMTKDVVANESIMSVLMASGLVTGYLDFWIQIMKPAEGIRADIGKDISVLEIFQNLGKSEKQVKAELLALAQAKISRSEKVNTYYQFCRYVLNPKSFGYDQKKRSVLQLPSIIRIKNQMVEHLLEVELNESEKIDLFSSLAASGGTKKTDELLVSFKESLFKKPYSQKKYKLIEKWLNERLFYGAEVRMGFVEELTTPYLKALAKRIEMDDLKNPVLTEDKSRFVNWVLSLSAEEAGAERDAYLEKIALELNMDTDETLKIIDEHKQDNWRSINPAYMDLASIMSEELYDLPVKARIDFIWYLISPSGKDLPKSLHEFMVKRFIREMMINKKSNNDTQRIQTEQQNLKSASDKAEAVSFLLSSQLAQTRPWQRVVLINYLLKSGANALIAQPQYQYYILRKMLGYVPESQEEKVIISYIKVSPKSMGTLILSYLLAMRDQKEDKINRFLLFGALGRKGAQLGASFKLFDEDTNRRADDIKDSAQGMDYLLIRYAYDSLSIEEQSLLKRPVAILGSASIKTVVLWELVAKNGDGSPKYVIMALQTPKLKSQLRTNIETARALVGEVKKLDPEFKDQTFLDLISGAANQVDNELDFAHEAKFLMEIQPILKEMNEVFASELGFFKFAAPTPAEGFLIRPTILFQTVAPGMTLRKYNGVYKAQISGVLLKAQIRLLFRFGIWNPDAHNGNFMISENGKSGTLSWIDFGQMTKYAIGGFDTDEIYKFSQLLVSIQDNDKASIVRYAIQLTEDKSKAAKMQAEFETEFGRMASLWPGDMPISEKLIAIANMFSARGLGFDKHISFGLIKGLALFFGQNYVSAEEFKNILTAEITTYLGKRPYEPVRYVKQGVEALKRSIQQREKSPGLITTLRCEELF
jgi:hypothetical protein